MLSQSVSHELQQECISNEEKLKGYDGFRTTIYGLTLRLETSANEALVRRGLNEIKELSDGFIIIRSVLREVESWKSFEALIKTEIGKIDSEASSMLLIVLKFSKFMWETAGHEERRAALLTAVSSNDEQFRIPHSNTEIDDLIIKAYGEFLVASITGESIDFLQSGYSLLDMNTLAECAFHWIVKSGLSIVDKPFQIATQGIEAVLPNIEKAVTAVDFILGTTEEDVVVKSLDQIRNNEVDAVAPPPAAPPPTANTRSYRTVLL